MRKIFCDNCDRVIRSKERFRAGFCECQGRLVIHIKGSSELKTRLPDGNYVDMKGHSTLPRRLRPIKKGGIAKNKYNP